MRRLLEGWGEVFKAFGDGGGPLGGGGVAEVHAVGAGFSGDVAGGEGAGIDGLEIQVAGGFFDPAIDGVFDGGSVFGGVGGRTQMICTGPRERSSRMKERMMAL